MRLKSFLITEAGRTQGILHQKCKQALQSYRKNNIIYRGLYDKSINFGLVDPKKFTRASANTENYYTLIVSNSPRWKNYPRRDQSLICSTERNTAYSYGEPYVILPFDRSRIGIVPGTDFWYGFEKSFPGGEELDIINGVIGHLLLKAKQKRSFAPITGYGGPPLTYKELKTGLDKVSDFLSDDKDWADEEFDFNRFFGDFWKRSDGDFYKYLDEKFDPQKNGFKVVKIGQQLPRDCEVWTDGISLVVPDPQTGNEQMKELLGE